MWIIKNRKLNFRVQNNLESFFWRSIGITKEYKRIVSLFRRAENQIYSLAGNLSFLNIKEGKTTDLQKIKFLLEKMGDKTTLKDRVLSCHNRQYVFNSDSELIEVVNI